MSIFGLIVAGRPVQTNFQQVDSNKFLTTMPDADSINHVVIFLTGVHPLTPGLAASIFFSLPDPDTPPIWYYLGYLTNEKPSAIYKLSNISQHHDKEQHSYQPSMDNNGSLSFNYSQAPVSHVAQIGISIEPFDTVSQMTPATETVASNVNLFVDFMNKTASNLHNYCSSFARGIQEISALTQSVNETFVPLSTIQNWYINYSRRLQNDPNFWKTFNT